MSANVNGSRLWRGGSLLIVGIVIAAIGFAAGTVTVGGFRLALLGYVAILGGIGYIGAAFIPILVTFFGGEEATWEDLSFFHQSIILFIIAIGIVILLLLFVTVLSPL